MGIASRLWRRGAYNIPSCAGGTESPVQTEARLAVILCRNYQEDKSGVVEEGESEGSQSWRKVAELISGTSGKRSFPRIMRADPGELAFRKMLIASPALTLSFSLRTNSPSAYPSPPSHPAPLPLTALSIFDFVSGGDV